MCVLYFPGSEVRDQSQSPGLEFDVFTIRICAISVVVTQLIVIGLIFVLHICIRILESR